MLEGSPPVDAAKELDGDAIAMTGLALIEVEATVEFVEYCTGRAERVCGLRVPEVTDDKLSSTLLVEVLTTALEVARSELELIPADEVEAGKKVLTAALEEALLEVSTKLDSEIDAVTLDDEDDGEEAGE